MIIIYFFNEFEAHLLGFYLTICSLSQLNTVRI